MISSFFFDHPTLLTLTIVASVVSIIILFVWNILLTVLVKKQGSEKKNGVKCPECGGENISVMKTSANEGNKMYNICQKCGVSWEVRR